MYVVIAIHYPKPEHIEDFLAFMAKVETVAHGSPGMLRFGSWREDGGKRLVGLSCGSRKKPSRRPSRRSRACTRNAAPSGRTVQTMYCSSQSRDPQLRRPRRLCARPLQNRCTGGTRN